MKSLELEETLFKEMLKAVPDKLKKSGSLEEAFEKALKNQDPKEKEEKSSPSWVEEYVGH